MCMSLKDAPDYTQLSDVVITGTEIMVAMDLQGATIAMPIDVQGSTIAIPVDIQGQTINLDVNIVASTVTINVSVQSQAVDIKIYTPSGRWTTTSETVVTSSYVTNVSATPGGTSTLLSVTGRGRLVSLGMRVDNGETTNPLNAYGQVRIQIYIDGALKMNLSGSALDLLSGKVADRVRRAGINAVAGGWATPYNFSKFRTSPDYYIIQPNTSPSGGLTYLIYDNTNGTWPEWGGYIYLNIEFFNSLEIKLYNGDSTYTAFAHIHAMIGVYP